MAWSRIAKERIILRLQRDTGASRRSGLLALYILPVLALAFPALAGAQMVRPSPAVQGPLSPPTAIAGLDARPTPPLEFSRAWLGRAERVRQRRAELMAAGQLDGISPDSLAKLGAALAGTLRVPVIPVHYSDVSPPFSHKDLANHLFGAGSGDTVSYLSYWREVSGGLLTVDGMVAPWVRLSKPGSYYLPKERYGWASFGRRAEVWREALAEADRYLDFGQFDNDGPDGIPNSGDDDGYVDFVAILYATRCDGEWRDGSIWPHRGAMPPFETNDDAAGGGKIKITDYVILPVSEPGTCAPLDIGVLAHETGHALGLPDLYDYDGSSQGIGAWGLMGTGSQSAPHSPAHLSAWSKEQLGWVRVNWLKPEQSYLWLPPVVRDRTVYRYDLPGPSGRYLLFENRQHIGSDSELPGTGLLIWRIDPDRGELGGWNGSETRRAVALIQADGRDDLARGRPADAGDPFPGLKQRDTFEYPGPQPLRLTGIAERAQVITANLEVGFQTPTLVADGAVHLTVLPGDTGVDRTVPIRREADAEGEWQPIASAGWLRVRREGESLVVTADASKLGPGVYTDTVRLVLEDQEGDAGRVEVELSVAEPGVAEVVASDVPWGWGLTMSAGRIYQASYGWDPLALRPRPRLLHLPDGGRQAETLARLPAEAVYAPVTGRNGGVYIVGRFRDDNLLYRVRPDGRAEMVATGLGTAPAYGTAALDDGSVLVAEWNGRIHRVAPDGSIQPWAEVGTNIYQIAVDGAGTLYAASYTGEVLRVEAGRGVKPIPTGFSRGRLVALTVTPDGEVFVGERGGLGRILRLRPDGTTEEVSRVEGAEFYGLAVEDRFLYALDLRHRQLLRVALGGAAPKSGETTTGVSAPTTLPPPPTPGAGP